MVMMLTGKAVSGDDKATGFSDDKKISAEYKPYVLAAVQLGIISSAKENESTGFYPEKPITRAEACVMLNNILKLDSTSSKPVFADSKDIPKWAEEAINIMAEYDILDASAGNAEPNRQITRGEAALMLYEVMKLSEK